MNDEIKETLEYKIDFLTKSLNIGIPTKNRRYFNDIKDYITNLQQENERLKEWKKDLLNENIELENIRKEAIEYINVSIEEGNYFEDDIATDISEPTYDKYVNSSSLLNILQNGSDDNE